jgi:hypothetical protein
MDALKGIPEVEAPLLTERKVKPAYKRQIFSDALCGLDLKKRIRGIR